MSDGPDDMVERGKAAVKNSWADKNATAAFREVTHGEVYASIAKAVLAALTPADLATLAERMGLAVVPAEANLRMHDAARLDWYHGHGPQSHTIHGEFIDGIWRAMLAAGRIKPGADEGGGT